jgi:hypothetical protein
VLVFIRFRPEKSSSNVRISTFNRRPVSLDIRSSFRPLLSQDAKAAGRWRSTSIHDMFFDAIIPFLDLYPSIDDSLTVRIGVDISKPNLTTLLNTPSTTTIPAPQLSEKEVPTKRTVGGIQAALKRPWCGKQVLRHFHLLTVLAATKFCSSSHQPLSEI